MSSPFPPCGRDEGLPGAGNIPVAGTTLTHFSSAGTRLTAGSTTPGWPPIWRSDGRNRMPSCSTRLLRRVLAAALLSLAAASCAPLAPTASVPIPPIPAGEARVWFYRNGGPYDGVGTPYLRMNEAIVGVSEPSGALYRGQQAYFKIVSLRNCAACGGVRNECQRDTFYVWEIPPEIAQGDVARSQ